MRVAVAGAGRRKAPSATQQVVLTACASEMLRRGSMRALLPNWAHCCRRCLLTLTANNVLLDDCALLKPERSQRLMKGSRKWRRMRATDADAGPCPRRGELTKEDYAHMWKSTGIMLYYSLSTGSPLTGGRRRWEKEKCFHCVSVGPNSSPADRVLCQEDASCWC